MPTQREPALREICERSPRLLRVERVPSRGRRSVLRARALLLLFDRLQLSVHPDPETRTLEVAPSVAPMLEGALRADEDDPWWMLLGTPLVAAWRTSGGAHAAVELQFREDGANPRIVRLALVDGQISIRSLPKEAWLAQGDAEESPTPEGE